MEEEMEKFFASFSRKYSISVVGIGGGASRIVNHMWSSGMPDVDFYAFGMNRKEMEELTLPCKFLIGQDGLGSGNDRFLAERECRNSSQMIETVLKDRLITVLVVCLGGGTGEGCIRNFISKAKEMKSMAIFLVATIPHSSEGIKKRKNALSLFKVLEHTVDGLYKVDYEDMHSNTLTGLFQEAENKIIEFTGSLLGMVTRNCMISFDFHSFKYFLNYQTPSRNIDSFTLTGSVDFLQNELKDWYRKLPSKYSSFDDVAILVYAIEHAEWEDDDITLIMDVMREFIQQLPVNADCISGIYMDKTIPPHQYRLKVFTKCMW